MARVLVVDDSSSVRSLIATRLRAQGYEVDEAADGESGAERALTDPPDVVVTDLVMKGISGVQLCRILRNEPATAHIPVVLLTASGDKRSRFWARSAGAAAYLGKDRLGDLDGLLPTLLLSAAAGAAVAAAERERAGPTRRTLRERISAVLDTALFESVIAGEVRALASAGDVVRLLEGLVSLVADVLSYRWMWVFPSRKYAPLLIHGHAGERDLDEAAARSVLAAPPERAAEFILDDRAVPGAGVGAETWPIMFAGAQIARLALGPTSRGLSRDDRRLVSFVAAELAGPMQMSAMYEDAQRLATTDALTGLLNRRAFLEVVERERARSDRHVLPFSLMLLDIDHFKRVNDTRGHAAGDAVLKGVARVLTTVARRSDLVARWGGEEFVIALPQTGEAGARIAAERVRRAIAAAVHPMPEGEPLVVNASIGVSSSESPWKPETLIGAADTAMYAAKARGRNRVEIFLPETPTGMRMRTLADAGK